MLRADEKENSSVGRELPRLRPELEASQHIYDRLPYWVYKDPLSLRYFRFNIEESFIIEQLRRGVTLEELKEAHRREFNGSELQSREVTQFISSLAARNLLIMQQPNRDEILYNTSKTKWKKKFVAQVKSFMFVKIPLCDPDRFFNRIIDKLRFIWTWRFLLFFLVLSGVGLGLIVHRWNDFASMYHTSFFTLYNAPLIFVVFWLVKAWHELGHGLTCKNYGGEVHEMGFLLLVFAPFLYCNITDSWTFPNKAHRLLATAGGVLSELFLAGLACILWYFTEQPSFIHAFAFNTIVVCSISTIFFNANPLMRFDGYYFIMDLIEVPNLRQRASVFIKNVFVRYLLGGRSDEMPEEHRFRYMFPLYALAALIYRWFIMFVILMVVYRILERFHLAWLGVLFVVFSGGTMLLFPLVKTGMMLTKQRRELGISNIRLTACLAVLVTLAGGGLFWPLEQHVTLNFILEPTKMHWMRSQVEGRVLWSDDVYEGAAVQAKSQVLARLENPELLCDIKILQAQIEQLKIEIAQAQRQKDDSLVDQMSKRLEMRLNDEVRLLEQASHLQVRAPFAGEILTTDRDIRRLRERYVSLGAPLLLLADTEELAAKVWVPEKMWSRIFREEKTKGQAAEMMLYAFSSDKFTGRVTGVSSHREDSMGEFGEKMALSNKVGGEVLTEYDAAVKQEKPMEAVYEVTVGLDKETVPKAARAYMSGRIRIDCGSSTLYEWCRGSLLRFISPEVRL